jgi:transposase InsO family protein
VTSFAYARQGPDILGCQVVVLLNDLLRRVAGSKEVDHQLDADARALDHGLPHEHVRVCDCNAHAERFVRSIMEEFLDRLVPLGEQHFRRALAEFVADYHRERHHQELANALIDAEDRQHGGRVRRRERPGGLLNYYDEAA